MNVPHLAFPLRFTGTSFETVEQQSPEHVMQQAEVMARTRPGMLEAQPEFGLPELAGRSGELGPIVQASLARFVPDAKFLIDEDRSRIEERIAVVHVDLTGQDA